MPRRKASFSSDDDEDDNRQRKRQRLESADVEERLESLIVRAGSRSALEHIESNLEGLATVLESDLANYKDKIFHILVDCVVLKPECLSIYTTLVALLNVKNYSCGGEFVELLVRHLKERLKTCKFNDANNIVRFLSDLVNCRVVNVTSVLAMFDDFVEVTLEDDIPQVRSDWFVFVVLNSLPWVGRVLAEAKENEFRRLLSTIENYLRKRKKKHVSALRVWESSEVHLQEDYLDCLWAQICSLQQQNWIDGVTFRPYLSFESILEDAMTHSLPQIVAPPHSEENTYPPPQVVFRLFDNADVPEGGAQMPGHHSIERYLIEDYLRMVIATYNVNRKDCCQVMLSFRSRKAVPLNYMIVEVVFGELFRLPLVRGLEVFFGVLLIELSRECPDSMPLILAQATEMLFERLNTMQTYCIERFARWFAYHLSNFKFQWNWSDWSGAVKENMEMPRPKFIKEVLQLLLEYSYYQNVVNIVPPEFVVYLPPATGSIFKYAEAAKEAMEDEAAVDARFLLASQVAQRLMTALKSKCTPEEANVKLKELTVSEEEDVEELEGEEEEEEEEDEEEEEASDGKECAGDDSGASDVEERKTVKAKKMNRKERRRQYRENRIKVDVLFTCLLNLGNKSLSHTFALIDKFQILCSALVDNNVALQAEVLRILHEVWRHQMQMVKVIVEMLIRLKIVTAQSVVVWIFSQDMSEEITQFYVFEIINGIFRRLSKSVTSLALEAEYHRNSWELHQSKIRDGFELDTDRYEGGLDEEHMGRLERSVKRLRDEQRSLFVLVFRELTDMLTQHLTRCAADSKPYNTSWYKWILDRLHQLLMQHHHDVYQFSDVLEAEVFTGDLDSNILRVYHQFLSIRA